jgi:hypothetical protein
VFLSERGAMLSALGLNVSRSAPKASVFPSGDHCGTPCATIPAGSTTRSFSIVATFTIHASRR